MPTFEKLRREMAAVRGEKLTSRKIQEAQKADRINDERGLGIERQPRLDTATQEEDWIAEYAIGQPLYLTDWGHIKIGTRNECSQAADSYAYTTGQSVRVRRLK